MDIDQQLQEEGHNENYRWFLHFTCQSFVTLVGPVEL